nr:DUF489 family protein [Methylogaea oryzae]
MASLFKIDAKDAPDVFGGLGGIQLGLRQLLKQLGGPGMDPEQAGYAATLLILERKFMADSAWWTPCATASNASRSKRNTARPYWTTAWWRNWPGSTSKPSAPCCRR